MRFTINDFVRESNRIEGIHRDPTRAEIDATEAFVTMPSAGVAELCVLVAVFAPGHVLRDRAGLDVRVGNYIAPRGGPDIRGDLLAILTGGLDAYHQHVAYEMLHPFTDGNGRSGRALWLRAMGGIERTPLGFLHHFYYQTLEHAR